MDCIRNLGRPPKTVGRFRNAEAIETAHRQFASGGPESAAIIQRRKSSEPVPRNARRKARILNREICEPREQSIPNANLELAQLGWIQHDSLGFGGKGETRISRINTNPFKKFNHRWTRMNTDEGRKGRGLSREFHELARMA